VERLGAARIKYTPTLSIMLSDVACAFVSIIGTSCNLGYVIVLFKHADDPKADRDSSSRSAQSAHNMRNASAQDALSLQSQALVVRPTPRAV
jgi:hypothetical protein